MSFKKYTFSEQAILTTLLYSDIFSFPLTKDELWKFLIAGEKISREEFEKSLSSLHNIIVQQSGYYCLLRREEICKKRKENIAEVKKKLQLAAFAAGRISRIPSVLFIGLSGGLSVGDVTQKDDIDLVIISRKDTLFVSRLFVLSLLQSLGVRRSRNQKNTADTLCINLLFDETALDWFGKHKDIYTAREIAQMVPLFERDKMYSKFINANKWIERFLPNTMSFLCKQELFDPVFGGDNKNASKNNNFGAKLVTIFFFNPFFESLSRGLQMNLMKGHQTNEIVQKHVLAFHPNDYRIETLKQLRLKMRQFGLLTKI